MGCRGLQAVHICQVNELTQLGKHSPSKKQVTQMQKRHTKWRNTSLVVIQHIAGQNTTHAVEGCRGLHDKHICQENGHTKLGSHSPSKRKVRRRNIRKGKNAYCRYLIQRCLNRCPWETSTERISERCSHVSKGRWNGLATTSRTKQKEKHYIGGA